MRKCSKCKCEKDKSEFYYRKTEKRYQSYCKKCLHVSQSQRWIERKIRAVSLMGGRCSQCGYDKNYAALEFHHIDPSQKEADWGKLKLRSWDKIIQELKKCILVCRNCHAEIHSSHAQINDDYKVIIDLNRDRLKSTGRCPGCENETYGTKYCSRTCSGVGQRKAKRPDNETLQAEIKNMGYVSTGRKYGVSDNCIRKWEKVYKKMGKS